MQPAIHRFPPMDRVIYGTPFAEAAAQEVGRLQAQSVYLLASATVSAGTDVLEQLRQALGGRLVGVCTRIRAHTPRGDVVAAANEARSTSVDLLLTVGGGSVTDAAKMVGLCLGNEITEPGQLDR